MANRNKFWIKFWDIVKKGSMLSCIGAFVFLVAWSLYTQPPSSPQSAQPIKEAAMTRWLPFLIAGGSIVVATILQIVASYYVRKGKLKTLLDITKADKADVSRSVFVAARGVNFDLLISENRLDFLFEVFNGSFFPVSISARSNGFVNHGGKYLSEYTTFDPGQSDDLQHGGRTVLCLRHEKIAPEKCSELQTDCDAGKAIHFDFNGLTLPVRITHPEGAGKPGRLAIPEGISCRKGAPVGYIITPGVARTLTSTSELKIG